MPEMAGGTAKFGSEEASKSRSGGGSGVASVAAAAAAAGGTEIACDFDFEDDEPMRLSMGFWRDGIYERCKEEEEVVVEVEEEEEESRGSN